jgi:N-methylhydantoinase B
VFLAAMCTFLASDQMYCPAAALDHAMFDPVPGTINVAAFPGAVTPLVGTILSMYLGSQCISRMMMCGPEDLKRHANATGGVAAPGWWVGSGLDRNGRFVADLTGDALNGSIGAFPTRDGVDTGGAWWWPHSTSGNAEEWEESLPFVYLYRAERANSGGAGRWRGGNGLEAAVVAHKTERLDIEIIATDPAVNGSKGLAGGLPGHPGNGFAGFATTIREHLAAGRLPRAFAELTEMVGALERQSPKASFGLGADDVLVYEYVAGGGFGDPLARDPDAVATDVHEGTVTREFAETVHAVVLDENGRPDAARTAVARRDLRDRRIAAAAWPNMARMKPESELTGLEVVFEGLSTGRDAKGESWWACTGCGHGLAPLRENYKLGAKVLEANPADLPGLGYPDPGDFCDEPLVMRQFVCPDCGELFASDLCRPTDPPLWDIALVGPQS